MTAPGLDAPSDDEQLTTLRPTLVVRNGSSSGTGTRTYEFQMSTSSSFAPIAVTRSGIAENASGKTSYARRHGSAVDDAVLLARARDAGIEQFRLDRRWAGSGPKPVGYNNAGELFDPLVAGETVGTILRGAHLGRPARASSSNSALSYVRYALPATVVAGEFSMEIEGTGAEWADRQTATVLDARTALAAWI